ncbi:unnamed protein product [Larinioides sclopetarius]|uniref:Uncharacterized protein n=1 Tax=Larinioides sclopetarius TaxID=280406 RepID=A0AAV1Z0A9_9ARAC
MQKKFRRKIFLFNVFIQRLIERRKMQCLRQKDKTMKESQFIVEVADDNFEISPEDTVSELKSVTSEVARKDLNINWINELLKRSYKIREKDYLSHSIS